MVSLIPDLSHFFTRNGEADWRSIEVTTSFETIHTAFIHSVQPGNYRPDMSLVGELGHSFSGIDRVVDNPDDSAIYGTIQNKHVKVRRFSLTICAAFSFNQPSKRNMS